MKLYFSIYRQQGNWMAVQHTDSINYESQMHYSIKTKEEAIEELQAQHPGDEVYVDGIPAADYQRLVVNKKTFRAMITENNHRFGKKFEIGEVSFSGGQICRSSKPSSSYLGEDGNEKTVNYLWRYARKAGSFIFNNENYYIL